MSFQPRRPACSLGASCLVAALLAACGSAPPPVEAPPAVVVAPVCPPGQPDCSTKAPPRADEPPTRSEESLRGMLAVPGGPFIMGCDVATDPHCEEDERPAHRVILDPFYIDRAEVTAAEYKACVEAGGCKPPATDTEGTYDVESRTNHPINYVDWAQASAYCRWAGKRLPTEAEWERAARGTDGRLYPWGDAPEASCTHAVMVDNGGNGCGTDSTWPVGSKPQGESPVDALDMAGSVWEWTADWYANYASDATLENPRGPDSGQERVIKGGSWDDQFGAPILRTAARVGNGPDTQGRYLGFRCASTAP